MYINQCNWKGSPDGLTCVEYKKGYPVELPNELLIVALRENWVRKVEQQANQNINTSNTTTDRKPDSLHQKDAKKHNKHKK